MDLNTVLGIGGLLKGGTGLLGALDQGGAQKAQGDYAQQVFAFNSSMAVLSAQEALEQGQIESGMHMNRVKEVIGAQKSTFAGNGIVSNTGTAGALQDQTGSLGAHDSLMIQLKAQREALGFRTEALQSNLQGKYASLNVNPRNTIWSGAFGALGDVAKGFENFLPASGNKNLVGS